MYPCAAVFLNSADAPLYLYDTQWNKKAVEIRRLALYCGLNMM